MQQTCNGFRVEIPPKRRRSAVVFVLVLSGVVGAVGISILDRVENLTGRIPLIGACILVIGQSLFTLIVELFGKEAIELDGFTLTVTEATWGFKITRRFDITLMKNVIMGAANYRRGTAYVMSAMRIHFEYKGRMESIGGTIGENEAFEIIEGIRTHLIVENPAVTH